MQIVWPATGHLMDGPVNGHWTVLDIWTSVTYDML